MRDENGAVGMRERRLLAPDLMPMTFADMLREMHPPLWKRLELPPWLHFVAVHDRKDQADLSDEERERFLCALQTLINSGVYGALVKIHGETHYQHGTERFLPWHRVYLKVFEDALRAIHPDVALPYWDWTKSSEQSIPGWLASVTPTVPMPAPQPAMTVVRSPGTPSDLATIAGNVATIMQAATFSSFTGNLEGVHGAVHVWVGGNMSMIPTAPSDPIFWMHHANIDRLWWQWQHTHAGENPTLTGTGPDSPVMDPWATTEPDTRDTTTMGYTYV